MSTVVEHLSNLIRIPSVSAVSNCRVIEYATNALHKAGWNTREMVYVDAAGVDKINLIAAPPGQDPGQSDVDVAFVCHTDTVPYAADWPAALEPHLADGLLRGCGACDVKGFLACLLTATAEAPSPTQTVNVVLTADEEIGCIGAKDLLEHRGLRAKRMVIGEPTSLHPARAGKGYALAEVIVHGQEAHSAHPRQGRSAIYDAARVIVAIEELADELAHEQNALFDPGLTTLNVGTIRGGTAKNIVPQECRFLLEWRPLPNHAADELVARIRQAIEKVQRERAGLRCEVDVLRQQSGFETSADAPLVRMIERLTGKPATSIPFGSEASVLSAVADEVVVFGPGDMRTAHSSRECVPVSELEAAVRYVVALMASSF